MKQMLKPFVVIVLLTTIFVACKKGVEDNPPVNKLTASFSIKVYPGKCSFDNPSFR